VLSGSRAVADGPLEQYNLYDMTKRGEITGGRKAGGGRLSAYGVLAALLCVLTPAIARAAGIEAETGLLSPPMVDNKPVNVKVGFFLTILFGGLIVGAN